LTIEPVYLPAGTIDHRSVDWPRVRRSRYHLRQQITYEYPGPIADLDQRLVLLPAPSHGGQQLVGHDFETAGAEVALHVEEYDGFGNRVLRLHFSTVEARLQFTLALDLERVADAAPIALSGRDAATYMHPTHLTEPDAALVAAARGLARSLTGDAGARALQINRWVHKAMRYERGVTGVKTTAADAFARRAGVCQDYTHVMLALCRLNGIPARYVSGHLLGEGGTHAWVEVLVPAADGSGTLVARALDPTHGRPAGMTYITIAAGRDYRDVAPTTGTFSAPYGGKLTARKVAAVTAVEYAGEQDDDAEDSEELGAA
jgi:transglutaminase-like putative cysteine protease